MRSASGNLRLTSLLDEPGDDAFTVISLNLDDAMLARTARAAKAFERLGNLVGFVRSKPMHEAHDARSSALARNTNNAVGGHCGFGHAMIFG
jgi:hypothetical protein